jgi:hypothetical protein
MDRFWAFFGLCPLFTVANRLWTTMDQGVARQIAHMARTMVRLMLASSAYSIAFPSPKFRSANELLPRTLPDRHAD